MRKFIVPILLLVSIAVSVFFNSYKSNVVPPCMNADEAAFTYNAYSLATTGKDEFGKPYPLRLTSFGDYKMPLYSYLSAPFVGVLGLNELGGRSVNILLSVLFPLVIYLLATELFEREEVGVLGAFLVAGSLGMHTIGRHIHEAYLSAFLTVLTALFFTKLLKQFSARSVIPFFLSLILLLFSYHPGRIFAVFFLGTYVVTSLFSLEQFSHTRSQKISFIVIFLTVVGLFVFSDIQTSPDRVRNLLFFSDAGFSLKINELRGEGASALLYNKATVGLRDVITRHAKYFSPEFLAANGDGNIRFGYPGMAPMSMVSYLLFFIGLYYLFRNQEKFRYILVALIAIAPLSGSLSWADVSISRVLALFPLMLLVSAYGVANLLPAFQGKVRTVAVLVLVGAHVFFMFYAWDFYFNHYPKRAQTIRSWQCGYKELADYVQYKYPETDKFYITRKGGTPYIFLLFYTQYSPEKYHSQAAITEPDEYGFGQVERFDKYEFNFTLPQSGNYIAIGYPDDFNGAPDEIRSQTRAIRVGTEEIFWVYEHK